MPVSTLCKARSEASCLSPSGECRQTSMSVCRPLISRRSPDLLKKNVERFSFSGQGTVRRSAFASLYRQRMSANFRGHRSSTSAIRSSSLPRTSRARPMESSLPSTRVFWRTPFSVNSYATMAETMHPP